MALRLAEISDTRFNLAAVGGLPGGQYSLVQFGAAMVGLNSVQASNAEEGALRAQELRDNVASRLTTFSGVNMDEEMANVILFQNAFGASARLIRVADEMLQTIIDMMR
ncbi:MAG: hypothetical protein EXQ96_08015 [Alphaproteobacteria bacterium]|nr:hypothetical protein [Alphaproteobacteria bacterium]